MNRKKLITLEIDSALCLMQEIYNDIVEQKNTASLITKKMLTFMKDAEDMSVIGPVIKEQQKILNDCTEKKISLVKLQGILIKQSGTTTGKEGYSKMVLTDDERKLLEKLVDDQSEDQEKSGNYVG